MTAYSINGQQYREAWEREVWYALKEGDALKLERDPANGYDPNAIKVLVPAGTIIGNKPLERDAHVGFIPKRENTDLARWMDQGGKAEWVYQRPNRCIAKAKAAALSA